MPWTHVQFSQPVTAKLSRWLDVILLFQTYDRIPVWCRHKLTLMGYKYIIAQQKNIFLVRIFSNPTCGLSINSQCFSLLLNNVSNNANGDNDEDDRGDDSSR